MLNRTYSHPKVIKKWQKFKIISSIINLDNCMLELAMYTRYHARPAHSTQLPELRELGLRIDRTPDQSEHE